MEKINRAQAFANQEKAANYMLAKKTFELNPHHPVIKLMLEKVKYVVDSDEETAQVTKMELEEYTDVLYNMALLNSGFLIESPSEFTQPL